VCCKNSLKKEEEMGLKILYVDVENDQVLKEIELTEEELKALSFDIADVVEFHINFIKNRVRRNINKIVEEAIKPKSKLLSVQDKKALIESFLKKGIFVANVKEIPMEIKKEIVRKVNLDVLKPCIED